MKDIPGYEGLYAVTIDGQVWSYPKLNCVANHNGKWMAPYRTTEGYKRVHLRKDGKKHRMLVHRLVAMTYIPNPNKKPFVNHKDTRKTNNTLSNLEWVTHRENVKHALKNGLLRGPYKTVVG